MALQFTDLSALNLNNQTLTLTKSPDFNPQKTNDTAFSDLVKFFKNDEKAETARQPEKISENQAESAKADSERNENQEIKSEDSGKMGIAKEEEASEKDSLLSKAAADKKSKKSAEKNTSVKENLLSDAEKEVKAEKNPKKNAGRKISKAESDRNEELFSRSKIDQLLQNAEDFNQFVATFEQESAESISFDEKEDELLENRIADFLSNPEVSSDLLSLASASETENEGADLDFMSEKSGTKEAKVSKLDKEGRITVEDLRTKPSFENLVEEAKENKGLKTEVKVTGENTATITMNYAAQDANSDLLSLNNQEAGSQTSNFQAMLNNQIQQNAAEFVKAGSIVLKDNNQGTISLVLHPDDLGNVKIQLSLDGKNVTGHIAVASKEALQVFKDNSETLREAFIKNGFTDASFDVSYGTGQGNSFANGNEDFSRNDGSEFFARRTYSTGGVEVFGQADDGDSFLNFQREFEKNSVNIVA